MDTTCWVIPHHRLRVVKTTSLGIHSNLYHETADGWIQDERVFFTRKEAIKRLRALLKMKVRHTKNAAAYYERKLAKTK